MTERTKNYIILGLVAAVLIVVIGVLGSEDTNQTQRPEQDLKQESVQLEEQTQSGNSLFREKYMEGCIISPEMKDYCECTYDYMIDTYGMKKVMEIGMEQMDREEGEISPEMQEAVINCSDQIPR